jgi:hypothetical protein
MLGWIYRADPGRSPESRVHLWQTLLPRPRLDCEDDGLRPERDLIAQVFAAVIRESSHSIDHPEYEILAKANIKLVDQVEKGAVKDIVELFKKRLLPLVHRLLQLAVGEVHHRCDMFFGLRVFTRISQGSLTPEELNTLQRRLRLWEAVAKKVRIQSHDDDIYPSLRKIYTNKDSLQYPQTFFRNLIPKKMNQIDSCAVLEKVCRERVLGLFSKAIKEAPHPVSKLREGKSCTKY